MVVVPLLGACGIAALGRHLPRKLTDAVSIGVAVAVTAMALVLFYEAQRHPVVRWMGDWRPVHGFALGICLAVDPFGAGACALAGFLVTAALVFSTWHFDSAGRLFHVLMLLFLCGAAGFCLTGDLFNLFVFFELLSVSAYGLTGYKISERGPIQGALTFAVVNTVGSYFVLLGIALLYGQVGALNLAQLGSALAGKPPDALIRSALLFFVAGFGVKGALVPFHFWLADAYAVAPVPVLVPFSGIMVELGLFGIARVYWTVFSGVSGLGSGLSGLLLGIGVATALWGAVMTLLQPNLKRLLAFATVADSGLTLIGISLFTREGLAGSGLYVIGHGLVNGALFMGTGVLLDGMGTVNVDALHGKGKRLPWLGAVMTLAALALADLPPFGPFTGQALIDGSAHHLGLGFTRWIAIATAGLTGGAVLNAVARIFLAWGPSSPEPEEDREDLGKEEPERSEQPVHPGMIVTSAVLLGAGMLVGLVPFASDAAERAASIFESRLGYEGWVMRGIFRLPAPPHPPHISGTELLIGFGSVALALAIGIIALVRTRLPKRLRGIFHQLGIGPIRLLRRLQSGHLGDDVAWLVVGIALYSVLLAVVLG